MKRLHQAVPNLELPFTPCQADTTCEISHTSSTLGGTKLSEDNTTYTSGFTECLEQKMAKYNARHEVI